MFRISSQYKSSNSTPFFSFLSRLWRFLNHYLRNANPRHARSCIGICHNQHVDLSYAFEKANKSEWGGQMLATNSDMMDQNGQVHMIIRSQRMNVKCLLWNRCLMFFSTLKKQMAKSKDSPNTEYLADPVQQGLFYKQHCSLLN